MAQRKVYRVKGFPELVHRVLVNGNPITIAFTGAITAPYRKNGTAIIDDPDTQKALEKDKCFNKLYVLESTSELEVEEEVEEIEIPPITPIVPPVVTTSTTPSTEVVVKVVPGVTNMTDAKEHLRANFSVSIGDMPNKQAVLEKAEALGVSFPDWKQ